MDRLTEWQTEVEQASSRKITRNFEIIMMGPGVGGGSMVRINDINWHISVKKTVNSYAPHVVGHTQGVHFLAASQIWFWLYSD